MGWGNVSRHPELIYRAGVIPLSKFFEALFFPIFCGEKMNTQSLTTRITSLSEANKETLHLIHRLARLPAQPGSSPLNPDAGDARLELSAEIHQNLKEQDEQFELLQQEVEEISDFGSGAVSSARRRNTNQDTERTSLTAQVARLGEDLKV